MNIGDRSTESTFRVRLYRPSTGSTFTYEVRAVSSAQAQRIAQDHNPGWEAQGIA